MVVFYTRWYDGTMRHDFIEGLGNCICETDVSWWAVPGTLELLDY